MEDDKETRKDMINEHQAMVEEKYNEDIKRADDFFSGLGDMTQDDMRDTIDACCTELNSMEFEINRLKMSVEYRQAQLKVMRVYYAQKWDIPF